MNSDRPINNYPGTYPQINNYNTQSSYNFQPASSTYHPQGQQPFVQNQPNAQNQPYFQNQPQFSIQNISICPSCGMNAPAREIYKMGKFGWLMVLVFFLLTGVLCCWVPFAA